MHNFKRKSMKEFDLNNGQGFIFKNTRKEKDSHPDYKGRIKTPSGEDLDIALWIKKGDKVTFFSASVQNPFVKEEQSKPLPKQEKVNEYSSKSRGEDDLPF